MDALEPRPSREAGDTAHRPPRLDALLDLVELAAALDEIDRLGEHVSPVLAGYAMTIAAVVPLRHHHDRIPWAGVEGTADDGRDVARLRAAAIGSGVALEAAVTAAALADDALRTALSRALRAAARWGHADSASDPTRLDRLGRYFDSLVSTGCSDPTGADAPGRSVVWGVRDIVHGAIAGERVAREPRDSSSATIAIASFARSVHHAIAVTRDLGEPAEDRACVGAVHGLVAMAAVA